MMENKDILYYYCDQKTFLDMLEKKIWRFSDLIKSNGYLEVTQLFANYLQIDTYTYKDFINAIEIAYLNETFFGINLYKNKDLFPQYIAEENSIISIGFSKNKLEEWGRDASFSKNYNTESIQKIIHLKNDDSYLQKVFKNLKNNPYLLSDDIFGKIASNKFPFKPDYRIYFKLAYLYRPLGAKDKKTSVTMGNQEYEEQYRFENGFSSYYFELPFPINAIKEIVIHSKIKTEFEESKNKILASCKELCDKAAKNYIVITKNQNSD